MKNIVLHHPKICLTQKRGTQDDLTAQPRLKVYAILSSYSINQQIYCKSLVKIGRFLGLTVGLTNLVVGSAGMLSSLVSVQFVSSSITSRRIWGLFCSLLFYLFCNDLHKIANILVEFASSELSTAKFCA